MPSGSAHPLREGWRADRADVFGWTGLVAAGVLGSWLAVHWHARLGTSSPPFLGSYRLRVVPASALAVLVAAAGLLAVGRDWTQRIGWRGLLVGSYLLAAAFALALALADGRPGLAGPVTASGYLADAAKLDDHPAPALTLTPDPYGDPPLPVLLVRLLGRLAVTSPVAVGAVLTLLGALSVPLVLVAVRSLAGEVSARQFAPVLALAPYAVWSAVSMDAVTAAIGAGLVTAGVVGSEHGRRWWCSAGWAAAAGVLLGVAALFSYSVAWLAASVMCVYFVRRRPLLNVVTAGFGLLPLLLAQAAGFRWPDGLAMARHDLAVRVGPYRSTLVWGFLGLAVLVIGCGPAVVASARKIRLTPGWPLCVGAALGIGFAVVAGLARGGMESTWLPFFPWLLVAAVAPARAGGGPAPTPIWLVGAGALTAIILQAVLASPW